MAVLRSYDCSYGNSMFYNTNTYFTVIWPFITALISFITQATDDGRVNFFTYADECHPDDNETDERGQPPVVHYKHFFSLVAG